MKTLSAGQPIEEAGKQRGEIRLIVERISARERRIGE
jgi:hypothetical protein